MSDRQLKEYNLKKYPFLVESDPKLFLNPYEILRQEVDLETDNSLPNYMKPDLMLLLEEHKQCFSLYGEIGKIDYVIDLQLTNTDSRYIRPYSIGLEERKLIDKEMSRLLLLGVIKEGLATFSSPVMLIAK